MVALVDLTVAMFCLVGGVAVASSVVLLLKELNKKKDGE